MCHSEIRSRTTVSSAVNKASLIPTCHHFSLFSYCYICDNAGSTWCAVRPCSSTLTFFYACVTHECVSFLCFHMSDCRSWACVWDRGPAAQRQPRPNDSVSHAELIMVSEPLAFLSRRAVTEGNGTRVWITTATQIHAWITTATWSVSLWLQPLEHASVFSYTFPPLLSSSLLLCFASKHAVT